MLVVFTLYMSVIFIILSIDALYEWRALNNNKIYCVVNLKRFTLPILTLMFLFLIVLTEQIINEIFTVLTYGFVNNTAILIGIIAIVYLADYCCVQYRLRNYDLVLFKSNPQNYLHQNTDALKIVANRTYIMKSKELNTNIVDNLTNISIEGIEFIINTTNLAVEPPSYNDKLNITQNFSAEIAVVNEDDERNSLKFYTISNCETLNVNGKKKKTFIVKKLNILVLFIICFIFGLLIQIL